MPVSFNDSETKINLMRAFAGESQARNRYTFAASIAQQQKNDALYWLFHLTAQQEKEHAEVFYNHLKEFNGTNITIDGAYPVNVSENLYELLRAAEHNEYEEHNDIYIAFQEKAKEEGFPQIAASFFSIAQIEKTHGDRFSKFANWMEQGKLYKSDEPTAWMCLKCGYIFHGDTVPETCPVCHHDKQGFVRLPLAPFTE